MSHAWKIESLEYEVLQEGLSNVITIVHWSCSRSDEQGNFGEVCSAYPLPDPDPDNFVQWSDLDESKVLSWMFADMVANSPEGESPKENFEAAVDAQIAEKATPTHRTGVPW